MSVLIPAFTAVEHPMAEISELTAHTVIPAGRHTVSATLLSPLSPSGFTAVQGWSVTGAGQIEAQNDAVWDNNIVGSTGSVLRWTGLQAGPMISARGSFWDIKRLALVGWASRTIQDADPTDYGCDVGLFIRHSGSFNGTKSLVHRVSFKGFGEAIVIGQPGDQGNDHNTFELLHLANNGKGLVINGLQALDTRVSLFHSRKTPVLVEAKSGGDVTLTDGNIDGDTIIFDVTGTLDTVASNNNRFTFTRGKVDGTNKEVTFVRCLTNASVRCRIEDLHFPSVNNQDNKNPPMRQRATLSGPDQELVLNRIENLNGASTFRIDGQSGIRIEDTILRAPLADYVDENSTGGTLEAYRCVYQGSYLNQTITI